MKIKALAAMCKRKGTFRLYDRKNEDGKVIEQWLGTSEAVYPIYGVPYLTEENIITLFDISEKQWKSYSFIHAPLPSGYCFDHTDSREVMLDREKMTLGYGGRIVRPLITRDGLEFIDDDFLTPLSDVADMLEIHERRTENDRVYFAAKVGLMIVGVIMPLTIIETRFVENMETLVSKCRAAFDGRNERERREQEQMTLI